MRDELDQFKTFIRSRWIEVVSIFIGTLLLYLPKMANFSYSIDSEAMINDRALVLKSWISINRYGLVLLRRFLLVGIDLNPFFSNTLAYILMALSGIILLFILTQATKLSRGSQFIGVLVYLFSPIHLEQTNFVLQNAEVMLGMNLLFISFLVIGLPNQATSRRRLIAGGLLVAFAFSVYTSFVVGFAAFGVLLLTTQPARAKMTSLKAYFQSFGRYVGVFLVSLVGFFVWRAGQMAHARAWDSLSGFGLAESAT